MRQRIVFGFVVLAVIVGITAATGFADPNLANVAPHRHFIDGQPVGPDLCDNYDFVHHVATNAGIQSAFDQFHNNLHRTSDPNANGPVAPGLHNGIGGELTATAC
jgi:hypothetical protein